MNRKLHQVSSLLGMGCLLLTSANAQTLAIDEMAMFLATMTYASSRCGLAPNGENLAVVVANRGYDYRDFFPDARYGNVVMVKLKKAYEFEREYGKKTSCGATTSVLRRFLPELYK